MLSAGDGSFLLSGKEGQTARDERAVSPPSSASQTRVAQIRLTPASELSFLREQKWLEEKTQVLKAAKNHVEQLQKEKEDISVHR